NKNHGPTAVNQFRLSFFRTATHTDEPSSSFAKLSDLGFMTGPGTLGIVPSGPAGFPQTVPPIYFNNFSLGVNTLTTFQPNNTWHVSDTFSKAQGRHTVKFGGEFRYLQINERNTCAPNGDFTFDGSITGNDFADYLLGAAQNYNQCSQQFLASRAHSLRHGITTSLRGSALLTRPASKMGWRARSSVAPASPVSERPTAFTTRPSRT